MTAAAGRQTGQQENSAFFRALLPCPNLCCLRFIQESLSWIFYHNEGLFLEKRWARRQWELCGVRGVCEVGKKPRICVWWDTMSSRNALPSTSFLPPALHARCHVSVIMKNEEAMRHIPARFAVACRGERCVVINILPRRYVVGWRCPCAAW